MTKEEPVSQDILPLNAFCFGSQQLGPKYKTVVFTLKLLVATTTYVTSALTNLSRDISSLSKNFWNQTGEGYYKTIGKREDDQKAQGNRLDFGMLC